MGRSLWNTAAKKFLRCFPGLRYSGPIITVRSVPVESFRRIKSITTQARVSASKGRTVYVEVRAYYRPGSGEFFWRSSALSENSYAVELRGNSKKAIASCEESYHHVLFLQDDEWTDFWAFNNRIEVFHCNLRFDTLEEAWSHVAEHWPDGNFAGGPSAKWIEEILLYKQLGNEFFRPKRFEFDARPFLYNPLGSVKKVGSNWELEMNGADEPNRATVLLDSNFKLLAVTKNTAPH